MEKPIVNISILTPVFDTNDPVFQTFIFFKSRKTDSLEWIIIRDTYSDEEKKERLNTGKEMDRRVKYIYRENKSYQVAGKETAVGKYLCFLLPDIFVEPSFFDKAFLFLELHSCYSFVGAYLSNIEKDKKIKGKYICNAGLIRREIIDQFVLDEKTGLVINIHNTGNRVYIIPELLFNSYKSEKTRPIILKERQIPQERFYPDQHFNPFFYIAPSLTIEDENIETNRSSKQLFCFFPWLEVGGADQFNLQLLEGLKEKGWAITIVTTLKSSHPLQSRFYLITEDIFHLANLGDEVVYSSYIEFLIKSRKPSHILISNSLYGYYLLPWLKHSFPGILLVDYIHCEELDWYNGGYPFFSAMFTALLDKTYVSSTHLRNWCISRGADVASIELCYTNIDTNLVRKDILQRAEKRSKLRLPENTPLILYVARLTRQKQPLLMTAVLSELKKRKLNFYCVVIGDGPDRNIMLRDIQKRKLGQDIYFAGSLPNEEVMKYMDAADIFFLPSLYEGIALSIFEAMAKELSIVATDTGGQKELVTEECGFLIKTKDVASDVISYADKIHLLLEETKLMKQMGKAARQRVKHNFPLSSMIENMHTSLENITIKNVDGATSRRLYLGILNRMFYLKREYEELTEITDSRPVKFIIKNKKAFRLTRKIYGKIKRLFKK